MVSKHTCVSIENAELLKIRRSYLKIALIKVWHVYHFYNNQTNHMDYRVSWHCSPEAELNRVKSSSIFLECFK